MKLLVDNNISPHLARAVAHVVHLDGQDVVVLRDKFCESVPDVEWIAALGREGGWAFLSDDHRIRKNAAERVACAVRA